MERPQHRQDIRPARPNLRIDGKDGAPSFTKAFAGATRAHPIAKLIRDVRHLDRLKETFVKGFVLEGNYKGRIHCQFNQLRSDEDGTVTGRFSSSQPNLQQIPEKGGRRQAGTKDVPARAVAATGTSWTTTRSNSGWSSTTHMSWTAGGYADAQARKRWSRSSTPIRGTDYHQSVADKIGRGRDVRPRP